MHSIPRRHRALAASMLALLVVSACGKQSAPSGDLQRDLELARSTGVDLLPRGQQVVSPLETAPQGTQRRAERPQSDRASSRPAPRSPARVARPASEPSPQPVANEPAKTETQGAPVPAPTSTPATVQPPPRGGYKTVDEIIRRAPFPINP